MQTGRCRRHCICLQWQRELPGPPLLPSPRHDRRLPRPCRRLPLLPQRRHRGPPRPHGRLADAQSFDNVFIAPNGSGTRTTTVRPPFRWLLPTDIIVQSQRATLANGAFPSGSTGVDSAPFYVLTVSRGVSAITSLMNARCEARDSFSAYAQAGDLAHARRRGTEQPKSGGCSDPVHRGMTRAIQRRRYLHPHGQLPATSLAMMVAPRREVARPSAKMPQL